MKIIITEAQYDTLTEENLRNFLYSFWDRQKKQGEEPSLDEMIYNIFDINKESREDYDTIRPIWYEYNGGYNALKDKIKKDLKIDLGNVSRDAERFGEIIGVKMATVCPDALMKMADFDDSEDDVTSREFTGKIVAIDDNKIVEFSVKDSSNRLTKFYWLTFIESNIELTTQYKNLKDKDVNIVYITQEFFDSRIGEYRFFNVILNLEVLDK